jgi:hypothetical protein
VGCIEQLPYEVLLSGVSFKECRDYIVKHFREIYYVDPGFKIFDKFIIGIPPVAIGLEGDIVVFPFTKPCYGTFLLRVPEAEEASRLRALKLRTKP